MSGRKGKGKQKDNKVTPAQGASTPPPPPPPPPPPQGPSQRGGELQSNNPPQRQLQVSGLLAAIRNSDHRKNLKKTTTTPSEGSEGTSTADKAPQSFAAMAAAGRSGLKKVARPEQQERPADAGGIAAAALAQRASLRSASDRADSAPPPPSTKPLSELERQQQRILRRGGSGRASSAPPAQPELSDKPAAKPTRPTAPKPKRQSPAAVAAATSAGNSTSGPAKQRRQPPPVAKKPSRKPAPKRVGEGRPDAVAHTEVATATTATATAPATTATTTSTTATPTATVSGPAKQRRQPPPVAKKPLRKPAPKRVGEGRPDAVAHTEVATATTATATATTATTTSTTATPTATVTPTARPTLNMAAAQRHARGVGGGADDTTPPPSPTYSHASTTSSVARARREKEFEEKTTAARRFFAVGKPILAGALVFYGFLTVAALTVFFAPITLPFWGVLAVAGLATLLTGTIYGFVKRWRAARKQRKVGAAGADNTTTKKLPLSQRILNRIDPIMPWVAEALIVRPLWALLGLAILAFTPWTAPVGITLAVVAGFALLAPHILYALRNTVGWVGKHLYNGYLRFVARKSKKERDHLIKGSEADQENPFYAGQAKPHILRRILHFFGIRSPAFNYKNALKRGGLTDSRSVAQQIWDGTKYFLGLGRLFPAYDEFDKQDVKQEGLLGATHAHDYEAYNAVELNAAGHPVLVNAAGDRLALDGKGNPVLGPDEQPLLEPTDGTHHLQLDKNGFPLFDRSGNPLFIDQNEILKRYDEGGGLVTLTAADAVFDRFGSKLNSAAGQLPAHNDDTSSGFAELAGNPGEAPVSPKVCRRVVDKDGNVIYLPFVGVVPIGATPLPLLDDDGNAIKDYRQKVWTREKLADEENRKRKRKEAKFAARWASIAKFALTGFILADLLIVLGGTIFTLLGAVFPPLLIIPFIAFGVFAGGLCGAFTNQNSLGAGLGGLANMTEAEWKEIRNKTSLSYQRFGFFFNLANGFAAGATCFAVAYTLITMLMGIAVFAANPFLLPLLLIPAALCCIGVAKGYQSLGYKLWLVHFPYYWARFRTSVLRLRPTDKIQALLDERANEEKDNPRGFWQTGLGRFAVGLSVLMITGLCALNGYEFMQLVKTVFHGSALLHVLAFALTGVIGGVGNAVLYFTCIMSAFRNLGKIADKKAKIKTLRAEIDALKQDMDDGDKVRLEASVDAQLVHELGHKTTLPALKLAIAELDPDLSLNDKIQALRTNDAFDMIDEGILRRQIQQAASTGHHAALKETLSQLDSMTGMKALLTQWMRQSAILGQGSETAQLRGALTHLDLIAGMQDQLKAWMRLLATPGKSGSSLLFELIRETSTTGAAGYTDANELQAAVDSAVIADDALGRLTGAATFIAQFSAVSNSLNGNVPLEANDPRSKAFELLHSTFKAHVINQAIRRLDRSKTYKENLATLHAVIGSYISTDVVTQHYEKYYVAQALELERVKYDKLPVHEQIEMLQAKYPEIDRAAIQQQLREKHHVTDKLERPEHGWDTLEDTPTREFYRKEYDAAKPEQPDISFGKKGRFGLNRVLYYEQKSYNKMAIILNAVANGALAAFGMFMLLLAINPIAAVVVGVLLMTVGIIASLSVNLSVWNLGLYDREEHRLEIEKCLTEAKIAENKAELSNTAAAEARATNNPEAAKVHEAEARRLRKIVHEKRTEARSLSDNYASHAVTVGYKAFLRPVSLLGAFLLVYLLQPAYKVARLPFVGLGMAGSAISNSRPGRAFKDWRHARRKARAEKRAPQADNRRGVGHEQRGGMGSAGINSRLGAEGQQAVVNPALPPLTFDSPLFDSPTHIGGMPPKGPAANTAVPDEGTVANMGGLQPGMSAGAPVE